MKPPSIFITSFGSISPLGFAKEEVVKSYAEAASTATTVEFRGEVSPVFKLPPAVEDVVTAQFADRKYRNLDRVTKLSLLASRAALPFYVKATDRVGVSIGSARGTTENLEQLHGNFLAGNGHAVPPYTSPMTTAGGISSTVAHDLSLSGPGIAVSMTCASFLHSLLVASGLLNSSVFDSFLVGGAEAPLTPFTLAQMKALRIYTPLTEDPFPSRPAEKTEQKRNTLVLGEGAASFFLETENVLKNRGVPFSHFPALLGIGFSRETTVSNTGMDPEGSGIRSSMQMALDAAGLQTIDAIILHSPGTELGDGAELHAIQNLFTDSRPACFSTKYLTGHTFGASSALSLELALLLLKQAVVPAFPYETVLPRFSKNRPIKTCMINSAGFGGSIMSIIVGTV